MAIDTSKVDLSNVQDLTKPKTISKPVQEIKENKVSNDFPFELELQGRKIKFRTWKLKDKENEDKKLRDELKQIAEDIQDLFDKLGFEDLGKGPQKADFDIRWQDILYPVENSEEVTTGDNISFSFFQLII